MEPSFTMRDCGSFKFADVRADVPADWSFDGAKYARVELPCSCENEIEMQTRGFMLADRTLGVSIDAAKCPVDLEKTVRMEIVETDSMREEIFEIAAKSFPYDRRFNVACKPSREIAEKVLRVWTDLPEDTIVAIFRGKAAGFLRLEKISDSSLFVKLAAVDEKYRLTGAALSLYARAVQIARARGFTFLDGRISSRNTAVMNLYAHFGARFANPVDIFLKDL